MKNSLLLVSFTFSLLLSSFIFAAEKKVDTSIDYDKASNLLGHRTGAALKEIYLDLNLEKFYEGVKQGFSNQKINITKASGDEFLKSFQIDQMNKSVQKQKELFAKNSKEGEAFLAQKKNDEGVKSLSDGILYKIINRGKGSSPIATDKVSIILEAKFINGEIFAQEGDENNPMKKSVRSFSAPWQEVLSKMKSGSTWELYVSPKFTQGMLGVEGKPNSFATLVIRLTLLKFEPLSEGEIKLDADLSDAPTS